MEMGLARQRLEALLQAYVDTSRVAEEHRREEHGAVMKIQCAWRRRMVYKLLRKWNLAANTIQRVYRGHLGRERYLLLARRRHKALRMAYFNHHATVIQKIFRAYYSRKHVHSYYARKEFLSNAMNRASVVKSQLVSNYKDQFAWRCMVAAKKTQDEIDRFMETSHRFLGTECCKGVFYSPYLAVLGNSNQVEDEIRAMRKRHNNVQDMKELRRAKKLPAPELWRSKFITTVGPYFTQYDKRIEQEKQAKLLQIADAEFRTTLRDRTNLFKGKTLRLETEYEPPKAPKKKALPRWF